MGRKYVLMLRMLGDQAGERTLGVRCKYACGSSISTSFLLRKNKRRGQRKQLLHPGAREPERHALVQARVDRASAPLAASFGRGPSGSSARRARETHPHKGHERAPFRCWISFAEMPEDVPEVAGVGG